MSELSDKQLKIGIWWVTHKHQLKKWWVILIAVGDIILFLYLLFNIVLIFFTWTSFTTIPSQMAQQIVDFKSYQLRNAPQNIQILSTKIIPVIGQTNKYNLLAELKNPNEKWTIYSLNYHFTLNGEDLGKRTSFLLPLEQRYVIQYNVESKSTNANPQFFIDELNWKRVERPAEAPSKDFEVRNIETKVIPLAEEGFYYTRVTAEVENKSLYNFWEVNFQIILYRGNEPVAVNETTIEKFVAQKERELTFTWKEAYYGITNTAIVAEVNVLDPDNLFKSEAGGTAPLF